MKRTKTQYYKKPLPFKKRIVPYKSKVKNKKK